MAEAAHGVFVDIFPAWRDEERSVRVDEPTAVTDIVLKQAEVNERDLVAQLLAAGRRGIRRHRRIHHLRQPALVQDRAIIVRLAQPRLGVAGHRAAAAGSHLSSVSSRHFEATRHFSNAKPTSRDTIRLPRLSKN